MDKRLIVLTLFLLLGFIGSAALGDLNTGLVAHWAFDDGSGTTATDSSGNGHHGTLNLSPQWVEGLFGGALDFTHANTNECVVVPAFEVTSGGITLAAWVKPRSFAQADARIIDKGTDVAAANDAWWMLSPVSSGGQIRLRFRLKTNESATTTTQIATSGNLVAGEWHHTAAVWNGTSMILYQDGVETGRVAKGGTAVAPNPNARVYIGNQLGGTQRRPFDGLIDEVIIADRPMTASQIADLAKGIVPNWSKAMGPDPPDGAEGVTMPLLKWRAGDTAVWHNVYVGTNPTLGPADFVRQVQLTSYWYDPPGLVPGTTYYWRVDEVDIDGVTIHKGDVWSFSAPPLTAWGPTPADGATNVMPATNLKWNAGWGAVKHHLYFGDSLTNVDSGTGGTDEGERPLAETTYYTGPLYPETTYYWRVDEYKDGTTWVKGNIWSFTTAAGGSGVMREWWLNIGGGTAVSDLTGNARYPDNPDGREVLNTFEGPVDWANNYGSRLYGWLMPPESGDYTFWIATDDGGQLWLSTDADPANKVMIASVSGWTNSREWEKYPAQKSVAISLVAGQRYYIEALMKEGGGGDNIAVAWQGGPITTRQIISGGYVSLAPFAPLRAFGPIPANLATDVSDTVTLRWSAGQKAATHNVYFGTDATAVANATTASTGIYRGQQSLAATSYTPTEAPLLWNKTYYWRIDEVNPAEPDSPWKGAVWGFTTANYIIVDDFESYTDDVASRIFQTWLDGLGFSQPPPGYSGNGTGSAVGNSVPPYAERTIFHSGSQSMPLAYDNTGAGGKACYSETFREWASPQDWTANGISLLQLYVRGRPMQGSVSYDAATQTYTMTGAGSNIWAAIDEFHFAYKELNGDGSITVRVDSMSANPPHGDPRIGVMIRDSLDPGAANALVFVEPDPRTRLTQRVTAGGATTDVAVASVGKTPTWLRLTRQGFTFRAERSDNGTSWEPLLATGSQASISMTDPVYIGLVVCSHASGQFIGATFSNVSTTGNVTPAGLFTTSQDIGIASNSPQSLYVAVQDSAGKVAVVTNPNPSAVLTTTWTEWPIPLRDFAGVNPAAIKKMFIGVGDRENPTPDGTGLIYIDDIRLYQSRCVPSMAKPTGDFSGNCVVDYPDLKAMVGQWLMQADPGTTLTTDLNGDGVIDLRDLALLLDNWMVEVLWP